MFGKYSTKIDIKKKSNLIEIITTANGRARFFPLQNTTTKEIISHH